MQHGEVGIRELKMHLSAYLRKVEAGEAFTVTRHGQALGRIVPLAEEKDAESRTRELQEAGLLEWSGAFFSPKKPVAQVQEGQSVAQLLLEDRR